ncbi:hypothetical protein IscW_ISCW021562, partial [Ixodes scapularis]
VQQQPVRIGLRPGLRGLQGRCGWIPGLLRLSGLRHSGFRRRSWRWLLNERCRQRPRLKQGTLGALKPLGCNFEGIRTEVYINEGINFFV